MTYTSVPDCATSIRIAILHLINRSINKFFSFITFTLQINVAVLLFNCLVLVFCVYIHLLSIVCPAPLHNLHFRW